MRKKKYDKGKTNSNFFVDMASGITMGIIADKMEEKNHYRDRGVINPYKASSVSFYSGGLNNSENIVNLGAGLGALGSFEPDDSENIEKNNNNGLHTNLVNSSSEVSKEETETVKVSNELSECFIEMCAEISNIIDTYFRVGEKASSRYMIILGSGLPYIALYCFALVIERQGECTAEQKIVLDYYFEHFSVNFTQEEYISAVKTGTEIADFRLKIELGRNQVGDFWKGFFRIFHKSGDKDDLQNVTDSLRKIIVRFATLSDPNSIIAIEVISEFIQNIYYQNIEVKEISREEVDFIGVIPLNQRLELLRSVYENVFNSSTALDDSTKQAMVSILDTIILSSIYDIILIADPMDKNHKNIFSDAVSLVGIHSDISAEEFFECAAHENEIIRDIRALVSSMEPLGTIWTFIFNICNEIGHLEYFNIIINDLLAILIQVENLFDRKYGIKNKDPIAVDYVINIPNQITKKYETQNN